MKSDGRLLWVLVLVLVMVAVGAMVLTPAASSGALEPTKTPPPLPVPSKTPPPIPVVITPTDWNYLPIVEADR